MANSINVNVGQVGLTKSIVSGYNAAQATINRNPIRVNISGRGVGEFTQALGKVRSSADEFTKSMDASNARVLAFGASAAVITGTVTSFKELVAATVDVEKRLLDINVVLNLTEDNLKRLSKGLFEVARNTATSFQDAATAATELARQGLGTEETLRRLNDALILSRLSGVDVEVAVSTLTAALNGFNREALTSADVINRLANVDAAFAVSTEDLANGLSRASSVAQDAKVGFNELLAAVTAIQQRTARGGAVIGNGLKSIFTRIQRAGVRDALEEIGVSTETVSGQIRPAIDILKDYAAVYDTLSDAQKAYNDEQLAGVFQIGNLKAIVQDLNSEYSIFNRALATANNTTDQATQRNEELNKAIDAQVKATIASLTELASAVGNITIGPALGKVLTLVEGLASGISDLLDGEGVGSTFANGILKGLGNFLSGPGIAGIALLFGKLFVDAAKFSTAALKSFTGILSAKDKEAQIQQKINELLLRGGDLSQVLNNSSLSLAERQQVVLGVLQNQTREFREQAKLAAQLARGSAKVAPQILLSNKEQRVGNASSGLIPNFSNAFEEEARRSPAGAKNVFLPSVNQGRGKSGPIVANSSETLIPTQKGDFIFTRSQMSRAVPLGNAASGFVPNFSVPRQSSSRNKLLQGVDFEKAVYSYLGVGGVNNANLDFPMGLLQSTDAKRRTELGIQGEYGDLKLTQSETNRTSMLGRFISEFNLFSEIQKKLNSGKRKTSIDLNELSPQIASGALFFEGNPSIYKKTTHEASLSQILKENKDKPNFLKGFSFARVSRGKSGTGVSNALKENFKNSKLKGSFYLDGIKDPSKVASANLGLIPNFVATPDDRMNLARANLTYDVGGQVGALIGFQDGRGSKLKKSSKTRLGFVSSERGGEFKQKGKTKRTKEVTFKNISGSIIGGDQVEKDTEADFQNDFINYALTRPIQDAISSMSGRMAQLYGFSADSKELSGRMGGFKASDILDNSVLGSMTEAAARLLVSNDDVINFGARGKDSTEDIDFVFRSASKQGGKIIDSIFQGTNMINPSAERPLLVDAKINSGAVTADMAKKIENFVLKDSQAQIGRYTGSTENPILKSFNQRVASSNITEEIGKAKAKYSGLIPNFAGTLLGQGMARRVTLGRDKNTGKQVAISRLKSPYYQARDFLQHPEFKGANRGKGSERDAFLKMRQGKFDTHKRQIRSSEKNRVENQKILERLGLGIPVLDSRGTAFISPRVGDLYSAIDKGILTDGEAEVGMNRTISKLRASGYFLSNKGDIRPENFTYPGFKIIDAGGLREIRSASGGFIPNFASDAVKQAKVREGIALGISANDSRIKVGSSPRLKSPFNPSGVGIYNTIQESSLSDGIGKARASGMGSDELRYKGTIPNFAATTKSQVDSRESVLLQKSRQRLIAEVNKAVNIEAQINALNAKLVSATDLIYKLKQKASQLEKQGQAGTQRHKALQDGINRAITAHASILNQRTPQLSQLNKIQQNIIKEARREEVIRKSANNDRAKIAKAQRSEKIKNFGGKLQERALGLSFIIPQVAGVIQQAAGQESRAGIGASSAAGLLSDASSFAFLGAGIGGPKGAAIGAVVGGVVGLVKELDNLNYAFTGTKSSAMQAKEVADELSKLSSELTQSSDAASQYATLQARIQESLEAGKQDDAVKLNKERLKLLSQIADQELKNALSASETSEQTAKILNNLKEQQDIVEAISRASSSTESAKENFKKIDGGFFAPLSKLFLSDDEKDLDYEKIFKAQDEYIKSFESFGSGLDKSTLSPLQNFLENLKTSEVDLNSEEYKKLLSELPLALRVSLTQLSEEAINKGRSVAGALKAVLGGLESDLINKGTGLVEDFGKSFQLKLSNTFKEIRKRMDSDFSLMVEMIRSNLDFQREYKQSFEEFGFSQEEPETFDAKTKLEERKSETNEARIRETFRSNSEIEAADAIREISNRLINEDGSTNNLAAELSKKVGSADGIEAQKAALEEFIKGNGEAIKKDEKLFEITKKYGETIAKQELLMKQQLETNKMTLIQNKIIANNTRLAQLKEQNAAFTSGLGGAGAVKAFEDLENALKENDTLLKRRRPTPDELFKNESSPGFKEFRNRQAKFDIEQARNIANRSRMQADYLQQVGLGDTKGAESLRKTADETTFATNATEAINRIFNTDKIKPGNFENVIQQIQGISTTDIDKLPVQFQDLVKAFQEGANRFKELEDAKMAKETLEAERQAIFKDSENKLKLDPSTKKLLDSLGITGVDNPELALIAGFTRDSALALNRLVEMRNDAINLEKKIAEGKISTETEQKFRNSREAVTATATSQEDDKLLERIQKTWELIAKEDKAAGTELSILASTLNSVAQGGDPQKFMETGTKLLNELNKYLANRNNLNVDANISKPLVQGGIDKKDKRQVEEIKTTATETKTDDAKKSEEALKLVADALKENKSAINALMLLVEAGQYESAKDTLAQEKVTNVISGSLNIEIPGLENLPPEAKAEALRKIVEELQKKFDVLQSQVRGAPPPPPSR